MLPGPAASSGASARPAGQIENVRGLAKGIRRVAHAAGALGSVGGQVGVGGPGDPEGEPGEGFERLSERLGRGAMDRPGHGAASPAMSMRSPQGSRFQSPGGLP